MFNKWFFFLVVLVSIVCLAACGSSSAPTISSTLTSSSSTAVNDRLAAGILCLEATDLAVTGEQAGQMLVLWKAVSALSSQTATTSAEMDALYDQIVEILSSAQVQSIEQMTLSDEELTALQAEYAVQQETSEKTATVPNQVAGQPPDGDLAGMGGAGMPGANLVAGMGNASTGLASSAEAGSPSKTVDNNVLLARALINLMQQRASA